MSSIRKRLFIWLLLGLTILWTTAGAGIYLSVKRGEIARLDSDLQRMEGALRFISGMTNRGIGPPRPDRLLIRPPRIDSRATEDRSPTENRIQSLAQRWPDFLREGGPQYKIWTHEGVAIRQSESLPEEGFEFPEDIGIDRPEFFDINRKNSDPMRAMAIRFRLPGLGRPRQRGPEGTRRPNVELIGPPPDQGIPRNAQLIGIIASNAKPIQQTLNTLLFGIIAVGIIAGFGSFSLVHFALKNGLRPLYLLGNKLASVDASSLSNRFSKNDLPFELAPICNHLNELMERLEDGFERERRFSSDLAHELRTPVAELQIMAEVALRWPEKTDKNHAEETLDIAHQMQSIIESLLAMSRYENGQQDLEYESIELSKFSHDCWELFAERATSKNLVVNFDIPTKTTFETDPKIFRLILNNLFSNAMEYTPSGGRIDITGGPDTEETIICISNTVSGFNEEMIDHLFERFWRRDLSRTDASHSGLGLALSKACSKTLSLNLNARLKDRECLEFTLLSEQTKNTNSSSSGNLDPLE